MSTGSPGKGGSPSGEPLVLHLDPPIEFDWGSHPGLSSSSITLPDPPEPDPITQLGDLWRAIPRRRRLSPREQTARVRKRKQARESRRRNRR